MVGENIFKMLRGSLSEVVNVFFFFYHITSKAKSEITWRRSVRAVNASGSAPSFTRPSALILSHCLTCVRHTPLHRQQCFSNNNIHASAMKSCAESRSISKNYAGLLLLLLLLWKAQGSCFPPPSICEMYMFNTGLCCSVVAGTDPGSGWAGGVESHCGYPLWKYAHSL